MKFNDVNTLSRQERMQPPDLNAQQTAALILEAEELRKPRRGGASAAAREALSIDALPSDEAEVIAAYCEVMLSSDLVQACAQGDKEAAMALLDEHELDVNAHDQGGPTPLIATAAAGHTSLVAELVARGADVDLADANGRTAFWWAIMGGHEHAAALLLDLGASAALAEGASPAIPTPFAAAVAAGHEGAVALLLDRASGGGDPAVRSALSAQVVPALAAYAAEVDEGDIARAIHWFLEGGWGTPNPNAADADMACHDRPGEGGDRPAAAGRGGPSSADTSSPEKAATSPRGLRGGVAAAKGCVASQVAQSPDEAKGDAETGAAAAGPPAGEDGAAAAASPEIEYDAETGVGTRGQPIWHRIPGWLNETGGPAGVVTQRVLDQIADLAAKHSAAKPASAKKKAAGSSRASAEDPGEAPQANKRGRWNES